MLALSAVLSHTPRRTSRRRPAREGFAQVYTGRFEDLVADLGLRRRVAHFLMELLLQAEWRTGAMTTTKTDLAETFGMSRNTVDVYLDELEALDLVRFDFAAGRDGRLEILVYGYVMRGTTVPPWLPPALLTPVDNPEDDPPPPRKSAPENAPNRASARPEQRERPAPEPPIDVQTSRPEPADHADAFLAEAGSRISFRVEGTDRESLRTVVAEALAAGWTLRTLADTVLRAELDTARRPARALIYRIHAVGTPPAPLVVPPTYRPEPRHTAPNLSATARAALTAKPIPDHWPRRRRD